MDEKEAKIKKKNATAKWKMWSRSIAYIVQSIRKTQPISKTSTPSHHHQIAVFIAVIIY